MLASFSQVGRFVRKLVTAVAAVLILATSLPEGATYGTVFVRDWRNMAACQCLTDVWFIAPGAYARLSPDGKLMAYEVVDERLYEKWGTGISRALYWPERAPHVGQ